MYRLNSVKLQKGGGIHAIDLMNDPKYKLVPYNNNYWNNSGTSVTINLNSSTTGRVDAYMYSQYPITISNRWVLIGLLSSARFYNNEAPGLQYGIVNNIGDTNFLSSYIDPRHNTSSTYVDTVSVGASSVSSSIRGYFCMRGWNNAHCRHR